MIDVDLVIHNVDVWLPSTNEMTNVVCHKGKKSH